MFLVVVYRLVWMYFVLFCFGLVWGIIFLLWVWLEDIFNSKIERKEFKMMWNEE